MIAAAVILIMLHPSLVLCLRYRDRMINRGIPKELDMLSTASAHSASYRYSRKASAGRCENSLGETLGDMPFSQL